MLKRTVSGMMTTLLLIGMSTFKFDIKPTKAWTGTVYIRANGSIDPPDAPISTLDNVTYTLMDNIRSSGDGIIVERDNITIDGDEHTLQGLGTETGIDLTSRSRVTVENTKVIKFYYGIHLDGSNNINISGNTVSNDNYGIMLYVSTDNTLVGNRASNNDWDGIYLVYSDSNVLYENIISYNLRYGIMFSESHNNRIFHNNFINNTMNQTRLYQSVNNVWNDGYPLGGNYWSDYDGVDLYSGLHQNETGSDGLGDTPYVIDENNVDGYPLMKPHAPLPGDLNSDRVVDIFDAIILSEAFGATPSSPNWNPNADINGDLTVDIFDAIILSENFGKTA